MATPSFEKILQDLFAITARYSGCDIKKLHAGSRPIKDVGLDSLDFWEWEDAVELHFGVPLEPGVSKAHEKLVTDRNFTLGDLANYILQLLRS